MPARTSRRTLVLFVATVLALAATSWGADGRDAEILSIDYGALVERRTPTHSGEALGLVLDRLAAAPTPSETDLALVDPLVEPYAFVLPDAVDAGASLMARPFVEVGWLWEPGESAPAWAELLRSRRLLLESDGAGRMRAFLPVDSAQLVEGGETAGARALAESWPILRLALGAELRRLAGQGSSARIELSVYPYHHDPRRTRFRLGTRPHRQVVDDAAPDGRRPALDLEELARFFERGLQLEGALLEEGQLRLLGSRPEKAPRLLGAPVGLGDLAVAYRAVFHGGRAEPYMSLDRGLGPHRSVVNYGGRLRDTRLGLTSLLCDIRFKTFSLGVDPVSLGDARGEIRRRVPAFRTHVERFATDPATRGVMGQQTRLWFYPDDVELTLSPEADVMVMRRVRMTAAAERVDESGAATGGKADPAWTRALVAQLNRDYEALATVYPELAGLDQSVRLLTFFSWLRHLEARGALLPELDLLLDTRLPPLRTPRSFPQMLAFTALLGEGEGADARVFEQARIVGALDRVEPFGAPPAAAERVLRALQLLDRRDPRQRQLADQIRSTQLAELDESQLDLLAYQAQRHRMHGLVLRGLAADERRELAQAAAGGTRPRVFSIGIGGLDLGMGDAVERARGESLRLSIGGAPAVARTGAPAPRSRSAIAPEEAWKRDPARREGLVLPDHGLAAGPRLERGGRWWSSVGRGADLVEVAYAGEKGGAALLTRSVLAAESPELRVRELRGASGQADEILRIESSRRLRYRFVGAGGELRAERVPEDAPGAAAALPALPSGVAMLRTRAQAGGSLRLEIARAGTAPLAATLPAAVHERLLLGPEVDPLRGAPLPGVEPLPAPLAGQRVVMVLGGTAAPWEQSASEARAAARFARALGRWWRERGSGARPPVVLATDPLRAPQRWSATRRPLRGLEVETVPGALSALSEERRIALQALLGAGAAGSTPREAPLLVVSAEPPGRLGTRLLALAAEERLEGRALVVFSFGGRLRADLPARILATGGLGAFAVAEAEPLEGLRLQALLERVLRDGRGATAAPAGPERWPELTWYY